MSLRIGPTPSVLIVHRCLTHTVSPISRWRSIERRGGYRRRARLCCARSVGAAFGIPGIGREIWPNRSQNLMPRRSSSPSSSGLPFSDCGSVIVCAGVASRAPSPLSQIADDSNNWLTRVTGNGRSPSRRTVATAVAAATGGPPRKAMAPPSDNAMIRAEKQLSTRLHALFGSGDVSHPDEGKLTVTLIP